MTDGESNWDPPRRGQRFTLHLPVRYRMAGEADWHVGTTENVSRSGVMIRAEETPAPNSSVVVVISLPSVGSASSGCLLGRGHVVRSVGPCPPTGESAFAVTVACYRLEPLQHALDTITP
jgi:hypothetical protein